jgi:hypothetical protein
MKTYGSNASSYKRLVRRIWFQLALIALLALPFVASRVFRAHAGAPGHPSQPPAGVGVPPNSRAREMFIPKRLTKKFLGRAVIFGKVRQLPLTAIRS